MSTVSVSMPDSLTRQARAIAKQRGETLSDVVRRALWEHVQEFLEETEDVRRVDEIEARLAAGLEGTHAHEDVWAQLDRLESEGALSD